MIMVNLITQVIRDDVYGFYNLTNEWDEIGLVTLQQISSPVIYAKERGTKITVLMVPDKDDENIVS